MIKKHTICMIITVKKNEFKENLRTNNLNTRSVFNKLWPPPTSTRKKNPKNTHLVISSNLLFPNFLILINPQISNILSWVMTRKLNENVSPSLSFQENQMKMSPQSLSFQEKQMKMKNSQVVNMKFYSVLRKKKHFWWFIEII